MSSSAREDELAALFAAARAAWPTPAIDDVVLRAALVERLDANAEPALAAPTADDASEIALALACTAGDPVALAAFDRHYCRDLGAALARFRLDRAGVDDVAQRLRERMLLPIDAAPPRILRYAGRGLRQVMTVAAVRLAIDLIREAGAAGGHGDADVALAAATTRDPELELMHRAYAGAFKAAFEAAVAELPARERTVLRLHLVDGLTIDEIAALYAVHRASAARRLEAAREAVARATRRHLRAGGIDRHQLEEAFALVHSQLDLSIERVLRARDDDPAP